MSIILVTIKRRCDLFLMHSLVPLWKLLCSSAFWHSLGTAQPSFSLLFVIEGQLIISQKLFAINCCCCIICLFGHSYTTAIIYRQCPFRHLFFTCHFSFPLFTFLPFFCRTEHPVLRCSLSPSINSIVAIICTCTSSLLTYVFCSHSHPPKVWGEGQRALSFQLN